MHSSSNSPFRSASTDTPASSSATTGLQGVIAAETRLSRVDGARGRLTIAGYDVSEIAPRLSFETMAQLLLSGALPDANSQRSFKERLARARALDPITLTLLRSAARDRAAPRDA
jgi:citrate synthase